MTINNKLGTEIDTPKQNSGLNLKSSQVELVNVQIREHEVKTSNWELREPAQELYHWHDLFNERFFDSKLGSAVLSLDRTCINVLGHYVLERNGIGIQDNININSKHLNRKKWETLKTLLHEMTHQYQRRLGSFSGKSGVLKSNNYHNSEFRRMMKSFGLICGLQGQLIAAPKDPFVALLRKHGIEVDTDWVIVKRLSMRGAGESKLKKFSCQCNPPINVRVADKRFSAKCNHCGEDFKQAF